MRRQCEGSSEIVIDEDMEKEIGLPEWLEKKEWLDSLLTEPRFSALP
jgi:hypothetical protein